MANLAVNLFYLIVDIFLMTRGANISLNCPSENFEINFLYFSSHI